MQPFAAVAGMASSLMGFIQSVIAAGVAMVLSTASHETALPMAIAFTVAALMSTAVYWLFIAGKHKP